MKSPNYVPNTVLHEDMRDMVSPLYRIVATYRKNIKDIQYSEVVYAAKKADFNSLIFPAEIAYFLDSRKHGDDKSFMNFTKP